MIIVAVLIGIAGILVNIEDPNANKKGYFLAKVPVYKEISDKRFSCGYRTELIGHEDKWITDEYNND